MNNEHYFDVQRDVIDKSPNTRLVYAIGQRGTGKTYSGKKKALKNFKENHKMFVYVRRWTTEIVNGYMNTVFSDVMHEFQDDFKDMYDKEYHRFHVLSKSKAFWIVGENEDGKLTYIEKCGIITCISDAEHFKGGVYNNYNFILFDEFITEKGYIHGDKEPEMFDKIVNTVGRSGNDLLIYMAGNPDEMIELCPYLYSLRLTYNKMRPNEVYYYNTIHGNDILENNIAFIKISIGDRTLNKQTSSLFGTAEERMSISGDVKTGECIDIDYDEYFIPEYCLVVELPILADQEGFYHKHIYVYYGMMYNEAVCVVCEHREYDVEKMLYCRYEALDFRARKIPQTFRINIPPTKSFARLKLIMAAVDANLFFISHSPEACSAYHQIRLASKLNM